MELRQLEAFAATMSTGSVSGAARLLSRSQPAVSRLLQELEGQIGYPLFLRQGPRVTPTREAFLLFEDVERALTGLRQIRERAQAIAQGGAAPLHIAATAALAAGLLPQALQRACSTQAMPIHIRSMSAEHVVQAVQSGAVQWGLSSLPLEHRGLRVHWLGQAPCVAVVAADDVLAERRVIRLADLATRRLITMANRYRLRHRLDQAWAAAGIVHARHDLVETNASMTAQSCVRAGLGVALLEPVSVLGAPLDGVVVRPLDIDIPFFFGVITPQSQTVAPALQALDAAVLAVAQDLLPGFVRHPADIHADLLKQIYAPFPPAPARGVRASS